MATRTKFPELNEKLIEDVLKHIRAEGYKRYEQDMVGLRIPEGKTAQDVLEVYVGELNIKTFAGCKTKACFGGWGVLLSTPVNAWGNLFLKDGSMKSGTLERARKLFGFTSNEADFIFDYSGTKSSAKDYQEILHRLQEVRYDRTKTIRLEELAEQIGVAEKALAKLQAEYDTLDEARYKE